MKSKDKQIEEINLLEQNLKNLNLQKQTFSNQLFEIDAALEESVKQKEIYQIIGNIMVKKDSKEITKELTEKKETATLRIKSIEKQEKELTEKVTKIQKEVMKE